MKPPIQPHEKRPPYTPILKPSDAIPDRDIAFDQMQRMWVKTKIRRRTYICSVGDEHRSYWRTHWQQGHEDWVACEHEVELPVGTSAIIRKHIPSLSDDNDRELDERRYNSDVDRFGQPAIDNADLALRTCACGERIESYYAYVDHLIAIFGDESHYGG